MYLDDIYRLLLHVSKVQQAQGIVLAKILDQAIVTPELEEAIAKMKASAPVLPATHQFHLQEISMPNPVAQGVIDAVTAQTTLNASVQAWIDGSAARQQAAIDAAIAGGISAADMAGVQKALDDMKADAPKLPAALVANTPLAKKP